MPKRLHAYVSGHVQGVGFRFFVIETARDLGLVGEVRNLMDGRVEVVAEGPAEILEDLLAALRRGPGMAHVDQVRVSWEPATGEYPNFRVSR